MPDNKKANLEIYLNPNFRFLDVSFPYIYSLVSRYNNISGEAAIRKDEFTKHHYFNPFLSLELKKNKFIVSLRVKKGFLCLSYEDTTTPPPEVLLVADALLKLYYYKELAPNDKDTIKTLYDNLYNQNSSKLPPKKKLEDIIKAVRECEIEEICFDKDLNMKLVPYTEESTEELEKLADLEGKICGRNAVESVIKLEMREKNKVVEIDSYESE